MRISIAGYILLYLANHVLLHINNLPVYAAAVLVLIVLLCDILATRKPEFTAILIAQRQHVAAGVTTLSLLVGSFLLVRSRGNSPLGQSFIVLLQFALQGAVVGVMVRMLVLAVFARLLKGSPIDTHRALLLVAISIFLWLFPLGESHRFYASFYVFGFGLGFALHHLVRNEEHRRAQIARHGRHIVELLGSTPLSSDEIDAVRYYANQRWRKLDRLLRQHERRPTTVLAIVKASEERIKGRYPEARNTVETELEREEHDESLDTYLLLHKALSLGDQGPKSQMLDALKRARERNPKCLLTLVTTGLRIAEEIPLNYDDRAGDLAVEDRTKEALAFVWEALKQNDIVQPALAARILGRAVPVTWTFLLDAYAYVLLKAGHHRFSRALLTECIYEDPYFSSPYLHLGEWCIAEILRGQRQTNLTQIPDLDDAPTSSARRSRRVGALCLNIAIRLEGARQSLTARRANELLETHRDLLSRAE